MELQPKIKVVNEFLSGNKESVNYLFITDIHYGSGVDDLDGDGIRTYNTVEEVEKQLNELLVYVNSVVTIANNSPYVDFIVVGGDYPFTVDFANRTSGDIVSYHHGHEHKRYHEFDFKKRIWRLSTAMAVETIDIISVTPTSIFKRELDNILINELLRNGSENSTVQ